VSAPRRFAARWSAAAAGTLALLAALDLAGVTLSRLTRDANAVAGVDPATGVIATLGYVLVGAAAAILAALAGAVADGRRPLRATLAALLAVALADDALQLHETVLPGAGVPEDAVIAVQAAVVAGWAVALRAELARVDALVLALAGACLVLSLLLDAVGAPVAVEDAPRLLGQATLLTFAVRELRRAVGQ
jgi:hypothetical protein